MKAKLKAGRWMLGSGWGIGCGGFFPGADDITNVFYSKELHSNVGMQPGEHFCVRDGRGRDGLDTQARP